MSELQVKIAQKQARLDNYLAQETKILTGGVQAYGIGSRNLTRYQTDLANIQRMIKTLELEISGLERKSSGKSGNIRYGFVPSDV